MSCFPVEQHGFDGRAYTTPRSLRGRGWTRPSSKGFIRTPQPSPCADHSHLFSPIRRPSPYPRRVVASSVLFMVVAHDNWQRWQRRCSCGRVAVVSVVMLVYSLFSSLFVLSRIWLSVMFTNTMIWCCSLPWPWSRKATEEFPPPKGSR